VAAPADHTYRKSAWSGGAREINQKAVR